MNRFVWLFSGATLWLAGCDAPPPPVAQAPSSPAAVIIPEAPAGVRTLEWDELMPANFDPGKAIQEMNAATLNDSDPRAQEMMARLRALWDEAPVVKALDGLQVRLPGFVVPLDSDGQITRQFLLVPYYGACIHVPPPPANQTVLVDAPMGAKIKRAFDTVWVIGRLSAGHATTDLAKVGYTLTATEIAPYVLKKNAP